jgi:hypothetical protein
MDRARLLLRTTDRPVEQIAAGTSGPRWSAQVVAGAKDSSFCRRDCWLSAILRAVVRRRFPWALAAPAQEAGLTTVVGLVDLGSGIHVASDMKPGHQHLRDGTT